MKYETPELNALPAINAIQSIDPQKPFPGNTEQLRPQFSNEIYGCYEDWE